MHLFSGPKWFRRFFALCYFLLVVFVFVDFAGSLKPHTIKWILFPQFVPSLLNFFSVGGALSFGFIIVLLLTLVFGRVYCSFLCPLGVIQDLVSRVSKWKRRYKFTKSVPWVRYSILVVVAAFAIGGGVFLLYILDPYSLAGRTISNLVRPVYFGVNNLMVKVLGVFDSYALAHVPFKGMPWQVLLLSALLIAPIIFMAVGKGRLYCNLICPVGTFLGLVSKVSVFKVNIAASACTSCRKCETVCKAGCIDIKSQTVDTSRCVVCFNCLDSCKFDALSYSAVGRKSADKSVGEKSEGVLGNTSRREFFKALGGFVATSAMLSSVSALGAPTKVKEKKEHPVAPPGAESTNRFLDICTACHLCVSQCPTHVLQPSLLQYGVFGIMQPHMDYHSGFCNFECTLCGEVCPTGAILPLMLESKKRTQLGVAKFIKDNCIVHTDKTDCGACSEHCPTKAVKMVPYGEKGLVIPSVDESICIGCGACEYACPTVPFRAIYINGNTSHLVADLPKIQEPEEVKAGSPSDDFPF